MSVFTGIYATTTESHKTVISALYQNEISARLKRWVSVCFLVMMMLASVISKGQVTLPHLEAIPYATGGLGLNSQSGWTTLNSGDSLLISAGSLSSPSLPASTGNKVTFDGAGIDAAKLFTQQTSGTVYYSFLLNVTALGSLGTAGGYFTGFTEGISATFGATVWTRKDVNATGYDIGINPKTTAANTAWSSAQTINNTVFVVISYQMVPNTLNDVVKLWINPATGGSEPAATLSATNALASDLANINRILIRQDAAAARFGPIHALPSGMASHTKGDRTLLFDPYLLRGLSLKNRLVMAPMTRNRATAEHVPTPIMATYYAERADIGLLITEGTSPAPDGLGYPRISGLYSDEQVAAWKPITAAVHARGGKIFVQLMHTGRASHALNLPAGARVVGPMAVALPEPVYTDAEGLQPATVPHALTNDEVRAVVAEYAYSATKAIEAGFDGIELHSANGYLIEQFLNANHNQRTDSYGGSAEARNRFALEVAAATTAAIGADRVGIRLSPYGSFNDMGAFEGIDEQFVALGRALSDLKLAYLHLVNHPLMG